MANLINELVTGVVESVLKEVLKKSGVKTTTSKRQRQTRSATTGRFKKATKPKAAKPAKKQVSRRRTAAARSKTR
ncbi:MULTISPECIES: hypothetical protein [unclassified Rhizobium]|uniref:hypothetical protein n=1 Tax=unclassified Rhizobium TaxID=2613769 RepID=UPI000714AE9B|nr:MULTISPECIES: hypothetical protein [unclassified Rhizobium]KQS98204.1 hypothetical protein ASG50_23845 [Rhizobium sp. Leaf386]KQT00467.1 hypothetical protein ASG42_06435 [Rhizobium sp. Leaf391]KQT97470.1 hypothetical protein ASG68_11165 [Rhizobium sp. Leaf453]